MNFLSVKPIFCKIFLFVIEKSLRRLVGMRVRVTGKKLDQKKERLKLLTGTSATHSDLGHQILFVLIMFPYKRICRQ